MVARISLIILSGRGSYGVESWEARISVPLGPGRNSNPMTCHCERVPWENEPPQSANPLGVSASSGASKRSSALERAGRLPDSHFVKVPQEIRGVFVHSVGARALQLLLAISAREQAYPQRPGAARRE